MKISVIIPTLNEENNIKAAIESAMESAAAGNDVEIIVADGGSDDGTVDEVPLWGGITIISSEPGRARQMNAGAFSASGDVLLFLHADTRLPEGYIDHVRDVLSGDSVVAGAFELAIDSPRWGLRIIERLVNWRSRTLEMPYGDQAIFLKTDTFKMAGGFADIPIMEDFELVNRLRRHGRIIIAPAAIQTSDRRWKRVGIIKTTLINQAMIIAFKMGIPPGKIATRFKKRGHNPI